MADIVKKIKLKSIKKVPADDVLQGLFDEMKSIINVTYIRLLDDRCTSGCGRQMHYPHGPH